MLRFKQFSGAGDDLQASVNAWLEAFEPDVTQMVQTTDGRSIVISFLFEESFRGQERRLSGEHGMAVDEAPLPAGMMRDEPIRVPQEPGEITSELP
jgi:hypothetical protein